MQLSNNQLIFKRVMDLRGFNLNVPYYVKPFTTREMVCLSTHIEKLIKLAYVEALTSSTHLTAEEITEMWEKSGSKKALDNNG